MSEDKVEVDVGKVLEITRMRLEKVTQDNILLEAFLSQQQDEINQLKEALDRANQTMIKEDKDNGTGEG